MGFGRHQGKVAFVPFSVPGDRLRVRPDEEKKTFIRAEIAQVLKPGKGRVLPYAPILGNAGDASFSSSNIRCRLKRSGRSLKNLLSPVSGYARYCNHHARVHAAAGL